MNIALTREGRAAVHAARIAPMTGERPATGRELFAPVKFLHNHWLLLAGGRIADILPKPPLRCRKYDLGDAVILPPLVNCHTHLQLSWLAGKTLWRKGFTAWLKSMLPLLMPVIAAGFDAPDRVAALESACASLAGSTLLLGDVGGSIKGALSATRHAGQKHGLSISHFCEWFGFRGAAGPWPERCAGEIAANTALASRCAPAGHGLYSTSARSLRQAHAFCRRHGRVFSFHLAESLDETELLLSGSGALADLYKGPVLPPDWTAPGLPPAAYAQSLGLLTPGTLAVHGVHLNRQEIAMLAAGGAALCLCPRSNYNLGVGAAPVRELTAGGLLLCLGTDGLTSNTDLDVRREALYLRESADLPWQALWRMATVNGAAALGMPFAGLAAGAPAAFSVWPEVGNV